jgi:DNA modification methylase
MQGKETRRWTEYECRRYSAGHAFLKDGEQCMIPFSIAQRVSRMGLYVKSVISWAKTSSLPEPQDSRVSRNVEYVLHIARQRTPYFAKEAFRTTEPRLGGRNPAVEPNKLSDSWLLPTSAGRDGHGAQFPLALPGRCIAVSTQPDDFVLDPFCGAGTAGVAALALGRKFVGFDISRTYLSVAQRRLEAAAKGLIIEDENLEPLARGCVEPQPRSEGLRAVA